MGDLGKRSWSYGHTEMIIGRRHNNKHCARHLCPRCIVQHPLTTQICSHDNTDMPRMLFSWSAEELANWQVDHLISNLHGWSTDQHLWNFFSSILWQHRFAHRFTDLPNNTDLLLFWWSEEHPSDLLVISFGWLTNNVGHLWPRSIVQNPWPTEICAPDNQYKRNPAYCIIADCQEFLSSTDFLLLNLISKGCKTNDKLII